MTFHQCPTCGTLVDDSELPSWKREHCNYTCKECSNERNNVWRKANPDKVRASVMRWQKANPDNVKAATIKHRRKNGVLPYDENRGCPAFLGIHVAERVLQHSFKDVKVMPMNNQGYDFICNVGKKIGVKSACQRDDGRWSFTIRRNKIADYFLCLAFDNREDLNPLYMWLIPGEKINHIANTTISRTTMHRWGEYAIDIENVSMCCDILKAKEVNK